MNTSVCTYLDKLFRRNDPDDLLVIARPE
jgi:hypothetical protein